jgi:hypothetical protein
MLFYIVLIIPHFLWLLINNWKWFNLFIVIWWRADVSLFFFYACDRWCSDVSWVWRLAGIKPQRFCLTTQQQTLRPVTTPGLPTTTTKQQNITQLRILPQFTTPRNLSFLQVNNSAPSYYHTLSTPTSVTIQPTLPPTTTMMLRNITPSRHNQFAILGICGILNEFWIVD